MNRDINSLDPVVREMCSALMDKAQSEGMRVAVTSTLRSPREQAALYAQGRRALDLVNYMRLAAGMGRISKAQNTVVTHALRSMHEFGCAFDLAVINADGSAEWSDIGAYRSLGEMGEAIGLGWGGRFSSPDYCHFEFSGGLTHEQLVAGMRPAPNNGDEEFPEKEVASSMGKTKSGLRTSEFYLALMGAVLPVLNTHLGMEIPVSGVMSIAGVVISYIVSRTVVKRA